MANKRLNDSKSLRVLINEVLSSATRAALKHNREKRKGVSKAQRTGAIPTTTERNNFRSRRWIKKVAIKGPVEPNIQAIEMKHYSRKKAAQDIKNKRKEEKPSEIRYSNKKVNEARGYSGKKEKTNTKGYYVSRRVKSGEKFIRTNSVSVPLKNKKETLDIANSVNDFKTDAGTRRVMKNNVNSQNASFDSKGNKAKRRMKSMKNESVYHRLARILITELSGKTLRNYRDKRGAQLGQFMYGDPSKQTQAQLKLSKGIKQKNAIKGIKKAKNKLEK
jgi:hypothetical protein